MPLPGRNERERYVNTYRSSLRLDPTQNLGTQKILDNFLDALDGFSLRDIQQLFKLSRQQEPLKFEKLINLYKYGEKISPWEELSHEKLEKIEETLRQRVKGQDEAIEKVRNVVIRAKTGFSGLQHSRTQKKPRARCSSSALPASERRSSRRRLPSSSSAMRTPASAST